MMTYDELKKILEQVKKYHLDLVFETTDHLIEWMKSLKKIEIERFLSLEIPYQDKFEPHLDVLIQPIFLNSPYYVKDCFYILNAPTDEKFQLLYDLAKNRNSLQNGHHLEAMATLYCCSDTTDFYVCEYAKHGNFLGRSNPYFLEDLKLIASAPNANRAEYLYEVAMSIFSLKSKYHPHDMQLIFNADMDYKDYILGEMAKDSVSLNSKYHPQDMQFISQANTCNHIFCLYQVAIDKDSLESEYHPFDMQCIFDEKDETTVELLTNEALNYFSIHSEHHKEEMEAIKNRENINSIEESQVQEEPIQEEKNSTILLKQIEKGIHELEQINENKNVDRVELKRILNL